MKIPDGWIAIPVVNRFTELDVEMYELVMCRSCIWLRESGGHANCNGYLTCFKTGKEVDFEDYCSKGERA